MKKDHSPGALVACRKNFDKLDPEVEVDRLQESGELILTIVFSSVVDSAATGQQKAVVERLARIQYWQAIMDIFLREKCDAQFLNKLIPHVRQLKTMHSS